MRTAVDPEKVSISLLAEIGHMSVLDFVDYQGHFIALRKSFAKLMENAFIDHDFTAWREERFTQFIKQKRDEELERKQQYPTPYVDYLVEERSRQYALFCREHMDSFITFLLSEIEPPLGNPYYQEIACWRQELRSGAYPALEWREHYDFLHKHLSQTSYDLCGMVMGIYLLMLSVKQRL
ncbi:penicillin-binding protein [Chlamydia trachomatis]|nr:penicillin-binding protein [Chlamydia trachomatis]